VKCHIIDLKNQNGKKRKEGGGGKFHHFPLEMMLDMQPCYIPISLVEAH
jgi:hypothetical protein